MSYGGDLLYEVPLLPCVFRDGTAESLPVWSALQRSHEIVDVVFEVPTMFPAVLRQLVLPLTVDALGSPVDYQDWRRRFERSRFDDDELARLASYLDVWSDRFDLFHPVRPFAQVAGLRTASGGTKGAALLVVTQPTGNNVPLFASRSEADTLALPLGAAARWLSHTHAWDTAAIKTGVVGDPQVKAGKTSGNPTGPLGNLGVIVPVGVTLYDTLILNMPVGVQDRLGTPHWRRGEDDPRWAGGPRWSDSHTPDGLLDLWTWQARRIRLFPTMTEAGAVVERVIVAAGDRLRETPDWETHTAWRLDKPTKARPQVRPARPLRHTPGRAVWQGVRALLALEAGNTDSKSTATRTSDLLGQLAALERRGLIDHNYPLRVEAFGIEYGNQSAVVEDLIHDAIPMPIAALRGAGEAYDLVIEVAQQAEDLASAINTLSAELRLASGTEPIPWKKGQRPGDQLSYALDPLVRRLLAGVSADADDSGKLEAGQLAWEILAARTTRDTAARLFDVPASAIQGRPGKSEKYPYKLGLAANSFDAAVKRILPRAAAAYETDEE